MSTDKMGENDKTSRSVDLNTNKRHKSRVTQIFDCRKSRAYFLNLNKLRPQHLKLNTKTHIC